MTNDERLAEVRDRLAVAMGWPTGQASHIFEIIRKIGNREAIVIGIEKAEAIADRLESGARFEKLDAFGDS